MFGRTIGNYQVESLLGEGGMGKVYLAQHHAIERKSAIKILHQELVRDPQVLSRFVNEARASNAIRHPNIIDIYDCGSLEDGSPYIVMEYLEGETLATRMRRGVLSLRDALDFACQAASALAAAHARQVVHRDLKPENIFIVPDARAPGRELIKILDFGIAKLQNKLPGSTHKTRTGMLMGTPLYMSPEQCSGAKEVDARSDIYSLGCILYEMLCGRPPFVSEGVGELISMHLTQPPPPARTWNPSLPPTVEAVLDKTLAKEPDQRFQSMEELLAPLAALLVTVDDRSTDPRVGTLSLLKIKPQPLSVALKTTLSGTGVAAQTAKIQRGRKGVVWAVLGTAVASGAVAAAFFLRSGAEPGPSTEAPQPTLAALTSTPAVPPRSPAPAPALVEVPLDSDPPGAAVSLGDVVIGTTPTVYAMKASDEPVAFTFALDGYTPETVKALVHAGLRLKPSLAPLRAAKPAAERPPARRAARTPPPSPRPNVPSDDIKFER